MVAKWRRRQRDARVSEQPPRALNVSATPPYWQIGVATQPVEGLYLTYDYDVESLLAWMASQASLTISAGTTAGLEPGDLCSDGTWVWQQRLHADIRRQQPLLHAGFIAQSRNRTIQPLAGTALANACLRVRHDLAVLSTASVSPPHARQAMPAGHALAVAIRGAEHHFVLNSLAIEPATLAQHISETIHKTGQEADYIRLESSDVATEGATSAARFAQALSKPVLAPSGGLVRWADGETTSATAGADRGHHNEWILLGPDGRTAEKYALPMPGVLSRSAGAGRMVSPCGTARLTVQPLRQGATVALWSADVPTGQVMVPCWLYITDGLAQHGQAELVLCVVRRAGEDAPPQDPLAYLNDVADFAQSGRVVGNFNVSVGIAKDTVFGDRIFGFLYSSMSTQIDGVAIPDRALAATVLHPYEANVLQAYPELQRMLAYRIAARLASRSRYLPCPYWSDLDRKPVLTDVGTSGALLAASPHVSTHGATVLWQHNETGKPSSVRLRCDSRVGHLSSFADQLRSNPTLAQRGVLGLQLCPAPDADAWCAGRNPNGEVHINSTHTTVADVSSISTSAIIAMETDQPHIDLVDDTLVMGLARLDYSALLAALALQQPFEVALRDSSISVLWS